MSENDAVLPAPAATPAPAVPVPGPAAPAAAVTVPGEVGPAPAGPAPQPARQESPDDIVRLMVAEGKTVYLPGRAQPLTQGRQFTLRRRDAAALLKAGHVVLLG